MLALKRRLGPPALLTAIFLITVTIFFWHTGVSTHLRKLTVLGDGLWEDSEDGQNKFDDGLRLVVFGDSWGDTTIEPSWEGKGRSWTTTLCGEVSMKSPSR